MKRNISMSALMVSRLTYSATFLLTGPPNMDILDDPKYLINGVFYYTATLLNDLEKLGNKVIVTDTGVAASLKDYPECVVFKSSNKVKVLDNGEVTWFIGMLRESSSTMTSNGYSCLVHAGSVGTADTNDLIVSNTHINISSPVKIASRRIRILGHEQPY